MFLSMAIDELTKKKDLSVEVCVGVVDEIIAGDDPDKAMSVLKLLHEKEESGDEIFGFVKAMRERMKKAPRLDGLLDIVGTGGDGSHSVNISTGAAILAASAGALVAKHGNRASSSKCGSADVLDALGISFDEDPLESLERVGICFLYAPNYHSAAKSVAPIRKKIKTRTIFNLIFPLLNPTYPDYLMMGVAEEKLLDVFADAVSKIGVKKGLVVHGNGMDELTPIGPCYGVIVDGEKKEKIEIEPLDYGLERCMIKDLEGDTKELNAKLLLTALRGENGPIGDALALNAGAALFISDHASSIGEGVKLAQKALREKKGLELVKRWAKHG